MSDEQNKTEEPTPYRLEEARKRGEVSKSVDVNSVVMLIIFAAVLSLTAGWIGQETAIATRNALNLSGGVKDPGVSLLNWIGLNYFPLLQSLSPLLFALIVTAVVVNVAQTGPVLSTDPIKPDFKRLNPMQVIKKIFSFRTVWEFGKLAIKLGLLGIICYLILPSMTGITESIATASPYQYPKILLRGFVQTSIYVLLIFLLMAVIDYFMSHREYMKKMRMSHRDIRDEMKRRDGDPEVKSKQKKLIRDLLKKARAVNRVAEADVVITNPTHIAVALKYRPEQMRAPIVLAKGAGFLAARMRSVATSKNVPMMRIPQLARELYSECDLDHPIPERTYRDIAEIYRSLAVRASKGSLA